MTEQNTEKKSGATLLVVDDDRDIQNFIRFKLQKIGFDIVVAGDGQEAIRKVQKFRPDLILMDIMMPIMDGLKATEYLKKHKDFKTIPIIILSAIGDLKGKAAAYTYGANDYLTKPVDIITLVARVRSILESQRLKTQIERLADTKAITHNLFDYQHLFERIEVELEQCRKSRKPLSLLYVDIDYMKMINTENGNTAGDFVIRTVRDIVYSEIGDAGIVLNSNSDKILVILPGVTENKTQMFARQITGKIEQIVPPFDFSIKGDTGITGISASIGMVTWDKVDKVSSEKLISFAESALKGAKEEGRGKNVQYQLYSKPAAGGTHIIDKKIIK